VRYVLDRCRYLKIIEIGPDKNVSGILGRGPQSHIDLDPGMQSDAADIYRLR